MSVAGQSGDCNLGKWRTPGRRARRFTPLAAGSRPTTADIRITNFQTILNCGLVRTCTHLATSQSQSQTWLSQHHCRLGLNLTSSSVAGSGDNRTAVVFQSMKVQELTTTS